LDSSSEREDGCIRKKLNMGDFDKSSDKKTVRCRWIFIVKHKADWSIDRYNARLVANEEIFLM